MKFTQTLIPVTLIKRYKRFLADIKLANGETVTVHCPNSGSMTGCSTPGSRAYISTSDNPKRKYKHTLELVEEKGVLIGVNTSLTNKLVVEAIRNGSIPELVDFDQLKQEVKTSDKSRLDIMLTAANGNRTYIEVKNCSLVENGIAMFPDAITARGTKHLLELADLAQQGHRSVIFFLVQRMDGEKFSPAIHIDKKYSDTLEKVTRQGVEILVYQAELSPEEIRVVRRLPCEL